MKMKEDVNFPGPPGQTSVPPTVDFSHCPQCWSRMDPATLNLLLMNIVNLLMYLTQ